jgi:NAD-dependent deacetylase
MMELSDRVVRAIQNGVDAGGNVVFVTGAGISAESGIGTYRGEDGLWTTGGASAMTKATLTYFARYPEESWQWHLDRRGELLDAEPNSAHHALARAEEALGDRFVLITQNIDRLHIRAGNSEERTIEVHGHFEGMRCTAGCEGVLAAPAGLDHRDAHADWERLRDLLVCPNCGCATRPHILWFDEFYDEEHYRMYTAGSLAARASLCVTIGCSGALQLAPRMAGIAAKAGAIVIDVNPADGELRRLAERPVHGGAVEAPASVALPALVDQILEALA